MFESDSILLERILAGDRVAYSTLIERYQGLAVSQAFSHTQNTEEAVDLARDAFVRLHGELPSGAAPFEFPQRLVRKIDELHQDRRKRKSRAGEPSLPPVDAIRNLIVLSREVSALPEADRIALTLKHQIGLSDAEIGVAAGESAGSVGARVARALKVLRETLLRKMKEGELVGGA